MGCNSPEMLATGGWSATLSAANEAFTASTICWTSDGGKDIVVGPAVDVEDPAEEAKLVEGDGNIASRQLRVERDMLNKPSEYWQPRTSPSQHKVIGDSSISSLPSSSKTVSQGELARVQLNVVLSIPFMFWYLIVLYPCLFFFDSL